MYMYLHMYVCICICTRAHIYISQVPAAARAVGRGRPSESRPTRWQPVGLPTRDRVSAPMVLLVGFTVLCGCAINVGLVGATVPSQSSSSGILY